MRESVVETSHSGTEVQEVPAEVGIVRLAERQHGVVALGQFRALGLSASGVRSRVTRGRLHRIHRGVYAVGRPGLSRHGRLMAAVLAYGPGAVLSHRSAAWLWGLRPNSRPRVDVTVPRMGVRGRAGIELHMTGKLTAEDVTVHEAVPVTTVARTLVDLGDVVTRRHVETAVEQAEVLRLFDRREIDEALARAGNRRGRTLLSSVLTTLSATPTLTRSELEEAFLAIVRDAGVPDPEVNAPMMLLDGTPIKVDFLWRDQRLAVEADGGAFHRTGQSRARDARRDQLLRLAGYDPVRFTDRQVAFEPEWVVHTLRALASRAHEPRPGRARPQAA